MNKFSDLAGFYEKMMELQSAICVQKGGIAIENYPGRFFAADILELMSRTGTPDQMAKYQSDFARYAEFITPSQKPIHEMTLDEFEKVMNLK
jgi:hypothetical protein